jgi:hypothetical protein
MGSDAEPPHPSRKCRRQLCRRQECGDLQCSDASWIMPTLLLVEHVDTMLSCCLDTASQRSLQGVLPANGYVGLAVLSDEEESPTIPNLESYPFRSILHHNLEGPSMLSETSDCHCRDAMIEIIYLPTLISAPWLQSRASYRCCKGRCRAARQDLIGVKRVCLREPSSSIRLRSFMAGHLSLDVYHATRLAKSSKV